MFGVKIRIFHTEFEISEFLYYQKPPALYAESARDSYSPWLNIQFVTHILHIAWLKIKPANAYSTPIVRDPTYSSWLIHSGLNKNRRLCKRKLPTSSQFSPTPSSEIVQIFEIKKVYPLMSYLQPPLYRIPMVRDSKCSSWLKTQCVTHTVHD